MRFGCDQNRNRVLPFPGGRTICSLCDNDLIAKCGEIYTWHWSHKNDSDCDPWKEPETDWHRQWKMRFPDDCQEVIIEEDGEKHRADVKTKKGLVIEFQNSSISTSTIRIREEFYGNMVWVVNAKSFYERLSLRSVVKSRLRDLEAQINESRHSSGYSHKEFLKEIDEDIAENLFTKKAKEKELIGLQERSLQLTNLSQTIIAVSGEILESWRRKGYYGNCLNHKTISILETLTRKEYDQLVESQKLLVKSRDELQTRLHNWKSCKSVDFEGKQYQRVAFINVKGKDFKDVIALERKSLHTFFRKIIKFHSTSQMELYQYKESEYEFGFDASQLLVKLELELQEIEKKLEDLKIDENYFLKQIENLIEKDVTSELLIKNTTIEKINIEIDQLKKSETIFTNRRQEFIETASLEREEYFRQLEREEKEERLKIMQNNKGLYTFSWKHERKTWQEAGSPVYFDIGKDYLFERKGLNLFKKISIEDFILQNT